MDRVNAPLGFGVPHVKQRHWERASASVISDGNAVAVKESLPPAEAVGYEPLGEC